MKQRPDGKRPLEAGYGKLRSAGAARPRLGDVLIGKASLTPEQLLRALMQQRRCDSPLGRILTAEGICSPLSVHQALAEQQGKLFVDLLKYPPDAACCRAEDCDDYRRLNCLPWRLVQGVMVIAAVAETPALLRWARQRFGMRYITVQTGPRDIQRHLSTLFRRQDTHAATVQLRQEAPQETAATLPLERLRYALLAALLALGLGGFWHGALVLQAVWLAASALALLTLSFKLLLSLAGLKSQPVPGLPLSDAELPRYSLLVPMYRESKVVPRLIQELRQLDYPKSKLQILLLLEEDDTESLQAVLAEQPEACFEILRVPPSEPRTKPKAMNIGLRYATGDYLVIYDAEDRPDRQQLRLAAGVFAAHAGQPNLCLQGKLNYENYATNLLTRLFALEYGAWFETMLPGIARLGLPVPLGGTSNHFRTVDLRNLLGWDAYNVTEDADLGLRLYARGGKTLILPSRTQEEAPIRLMAWLKQRSRWVKGYMVTYLVQQRQGGNLLRQRGWAAWCSLQLFIAGPCLLFLVCPWLTGYAVLDLLGQLPQAWQMPPSLQWLGYSALLMSLALHGWQAWMACRRAELHRMHWGWCALFPFYWLCHSAAAYLALWELFHKPYYWAKTAHGEDPAAFAERPLK